MLSYNPCWAVPWKSFGAYGFEGLTAMKNKTDRIESLFGIKISKVQKNARIRSVHSFASFYDRNSKLAEGQRQGESMKGKSRAISKKL